MTHSSHFPRRRFFQYGLTGLAGTLLLTRHGFTQTQTDQRFTPRFLGNPKSRYIVKEYFSLTCVHCAHFSETTFPKVKKELIDSGKIGYYFYDFPTDKLATAASMVARSLPVERYIPFCESLLSNLDRWAFAQDINPIDELKKFAVFAGMSGEQFDKVLSDKELLKFILTEQEKAQNTYHFDATPTFRFNHEKQVSKAISYQEFVKNLGLS